MAHFQVYPEGILRRKRPVDCPEIEAGLVVRNSDLAAFQLPLPSVIPLSLRTFLRADTGCYSYVGIGGSLSLRRAIG